MKIILFISISIVIIISYMSLSNLFERNHYKLSLNAGSKIEDIKSCPVQTITLDEAINKIYDLEDKYHQLIKICNVH
jgi:hypothetical protein